VQDLLTASVGSNLAVDFLPGSFGWDSSYSPDPDVAARILWLDAFTANVDRSWRNPNLLVWHHNLWLIDHGAALYFHHGWEAAVAGPDRFAVQPYDASEHVLIAHATGVPAADSELAPRITEELLREVLEQVPDEWLEPTGRYASADDVRAAYLDYLLARLSGGRGWLPVEVAA
jgi:hypothetical protein